MTPTLSMFARWMLLASFACPLATAQDTQFLPEIDAHVQLNSILRPYLQAMDDREGGDPEQFTFGPSIELYAKPLIRLKHVTRFDLDDAKSRPLVLESGYRIITAPNTPVDNRAVEAATSHLPLMAKILLADRNRADLDWKNGTFRWRYRNKLTLQRTFTIHSLHLIPYVAVEPFYESQYKKWSATDVYAGCQFPISRHVQLTAYYEHENDTGQNPNRQNNYLGLVFKLFFSVEAPSQ